MSLKIPLRAKASVPKTVVKQKLRLHSLDRHFPQNTLMLTESRGEFNDLHLVLDFVRFAIESQVPYPDLRQYIKQMKVWLMPRRCCEMSIRVQAVTLHRVKFSSSDKDIVEKTSIQLINIIFKLACLKKRFFKFKLKNDSTSALTYCYSRLT